MTPPKAAVTYARVSTSSQADHGTSLITQAERCREFAERQGYAVVKEIAEDVSGTLLVRPGLDAVRNLAAAKLVDAVVVYDPDRLSRSLSHLLLLSEEFASRGVELLFVNTPRENTPEGQMLFSLRGIFAEYERTKTMERSRRGKDRKAREGKVLAGPMRSFGYRYIRGEGRLEIEEEEAEWVREIFRLFLQEGLTLEQTALRLTAHGVPTVTGHNARWNAASVRYILLNRTYAGRWHYGKTRTETVGGVRRKEHVPREEWIEVRVPAIVPEEALDEAAERLRRNKQLSRRNARHEYLLRGGILRCLLCGRGAMTGQISTGVKARNQAMQRSGAWSYHYRCSYSRHASHVAPEERCPNNYVHGPTVESALWDVVCEQITPAVVDRELARVRTQRHTVEGRVARDMALLDAQAARLDREASTLLDLHLAGEIDRALFSERMRAVRSRRDALNQERARLSRHEGSQEARTARLLALRSAALTLGLGEELRRLPTEKRRAFLVEYGVRAATDGEWLEVSGLVYPARVKLQRSRPHSTRRAEKLRRLREGRDGGG